MNPNITHRLSQRTVPRRIYYGSRQQARAINQELLQLVSHVRALQDQLMAQQYRQDLLLEQNQLSKSKLEKFSSRNQLQKQRIARLEQEHLLQQAKNGELQVCEKSLRSIYEEIGQLTEVIQQRAADCQVLAEECRQLKEENQQKRQFNFLRSEDYMRVSDSICQFIDDLPERYGGSASEQPVVSLRNAYENLGKQMRILQEEVGVMRRQGGGGLRQEKEIVMRLEYEEKLLRQRVEDGKKNERLLQECSGHSNLESLVQQMLVKEDAMLDKLSKLQQTNARLIRQHQQATSLALAEEEEVQIIHTAELRQIKLKLERLRGEARQCQRSLGQKTQGLRKLTQEQQMSLRIDLNLSSLKRLRGAEERNKYLKLKINQLAETASLLRQEQTLLSS